MPRTRPPSASPRATRCTYIGEMRLHMDQCESFLQEEYQEPRGHLVGVKFILVHVGFLCKHER